MKTERLYAIMVYLLNHGRTSASELAKYFEVSVRTIQRDIDSLCCAGIPVIAIPGVSGGYEIARGFQLDKQMATKEEYSYILTALRGLATAVNDPKTNHILEKITALTEADDTGIVLDFSVLREGDEKLLQRLQSAVLSKCTVRFTYTNNDRETRIHTVEPVAVLYRWYGWYLLAYSIVKKDYRTYKLVRMRDVQITDSVFTVKHEAVHKILSRKDRTDSRVYTSVTVYCKEAVKTCVTEYLKGRMIEEYDNGDARMEFTVVENEQFWLGILLSLGDNVEVIAPERIRQKVVHGAEKIVSLYQNNVNCFD